MKNLIRCSLLVLLLSKVVFANEQITNTLTIFVYPAFDELVWKSPKSVLFNYLRVDTLNKFFPGDPILIPNLQTSKLMEVEHETRATMGHTVTHVSCLDSNNHKFDTWTSFTGQNIAEVDRRNLNHDKIGLGNLFYDYADGHVTEGEANKEFLIRYFGKKRDGEIPHPRYLQVSVDHEGCSQLKKFITFFESFGENIDLSLNELEALPNEKKLYFSTNLNPYESYITRQKDPKAKVGGGCAPYGVGLLKMIGAYDTDFDSMWTLNLDVSENKLGTMGPVDPVSLAIGKLGNSWVDPGYPTRHMKQFDPGLIWKFIGDVMKCEEDGFQCPQNVSEWLSKNSSKVMKGKTIVLSEEKDIKKKSSGFTPITPHVSVQKMDGIILSSENFN